MIGFFDHWLLDLIVTRVLPIYALDAHDRAAPGDREYYRQSRECYFGRTLEEVVADRQTNLTELRRSLEPLRKQLADQQFIGGEQPNFADMSLLGLFIFVGSIASLAPLEAEDPLVAYADHLLASFGECTAGLKLNITGGH